MYELYPPGIDHFKATTVSSPFFQTSTTGIFLRVIVSPPIRPAILNHLIVLLGFLLPVDQPALWNLEPCEAGPPLKLCLFITHWNPFPLEIATTVTVVPSSKRSTDGARDSSAASVLNSPTYPHLVLMPFSLFSSFLSTQTTAAVYPSFSIVFHLTSSCAGTTKSVTGTCFPSDQTLVISCFLSTIHHLAIILFTGEVNYIILN